MKTAKCIEQQESRKAARDNGNDQHSLRENTQPLTQKRTRGDASYTARIAPFKWPKGFCPNPGGRPRNDVAQLIAKAVFELNPERLYRAYLRAALKGNGYIFQTLSDRAYGRLKERVEHEVHPYSELSDEDLLKRIGELERQLGVPSSGADALPSASEKPN